MVSLAARPDLEDRAARWFSAHWGVPEAEYRASIQASLAQGPGVPQWYVTLSPAGERIKISPSPRIPLAGTPSANRIPAPSPEGLLSPASAEWMTKGRPLETLR